MLVNVKNFNNLLRKATLNYSINSFHCEITPERITSRMIKPSKDAIVCLDLPNDTFKENNETLSFNFIEPNSSIVPYLNLIDSENVDFIVRNEKIIVKDGKQKSNLFFCEPEIPSKFGASEPKGKFDPFITIDVDEDFLDSFNKIKKIGNKFGKVYFSNSDKMFKMETTDKKNKFSNGLSFDIKETNIKENISICFDFTNFINMFSVLDNDVSYALSFIYIKEKEMGLMSCTRKNEETDVIERYYLMSKMEI